MAINAGQEVLEVALTKVGEHPLFDKFIKQYSLSPLAGISMELILQSGLEHVTKHYVFDVVLLKSTHYCCINNLRVFRLLKELQPDAAIVVRVCRRIRREEITQRILRELLIAPVLGGILKRDLPRLAGGWQTLRTDDVFRQLFAETGDRGLARLLRVDIRRLRGGKHV